MSNAESDRKPDESVDDDDEPDEWCANVRLPCDHFDADLEIGIPESLALVVQVRLDFGDFPRVQTDQGPMQRRTLS